MFSVMSSKSNGNEWGVDLVTIIIRLQDEHNMTRTLLTMIACVVVFVAIPNLFMSIAIELQWYGVQEFLRSFVGKN
jgi:hypothetical protein